MLRLLALACLISCGGAPAQSADAGDEVAEIEFIDRLNVLCKSWQEYNYFDVGTRQWKHGFWCAKW